MAAWIAPALIAAVIAAFVSVVGWFVTAGLSLRAEQRRRDEKTRDFMIALRAEIRSELDELESYDLAEDMVRVQRLYEESETYRVFVPRPIESVLISAIAPELFILPEEVIDPVVVYMRQKNSVAQLIAEVREFDRSRHGREQEISVYTDLVAKRRRLVSMARAALAALDAAS